MMPPAGQIKAYTPHFGIGEAPPRADFIVNRNGYTCLAFADQNIFNTCHIVSFSIIHIEEDAPEDPDTTTLVDTRFTPKSDNTTPEECRYTSFLHRHRDTEDLYIHKGPFIKVPKQKIQTVLDLIIDGHHAQTAWYKVFHEGKIC